MTAKIRDYEDWAYLQWRSKVFKRDNYTCQMPECHYYSRTRRFGRINAHHIRKWADAIHLRYDVHNGITLCFACHKKVTGKEKDYEQLFHDIVAGKERDILINLMGLEYNSGLDKQDDD